MVDAVVMVEQPADPEEVARSRDRQARHRRNEDVFHAHMRRARDDYRGKVVVVAGGELHAADSSDEAWAWAWEHHPDDDTPVVQYISREKGWRIYADRGGMVRV